MGTSNFCRDNTTDIYAVLMNQYNEDNEHIYPNEVDVDMFKEDIIFELETFGYYEVNKWDKHCNRNFPRTILAEKFISKDFGDVEVYYTIKSTLIGAYYDGASLDYLLDSEGEEDYHHIVDSVDYFFDNSDMNEGMKQIQINNARKWIEKSINEEVGKLENFYKHVAEHQLGVTARFSNGETIYTKINN